MFVSPGLENWIVRDEKANNIDLAGMRAEDGHRRTGHADGTYSIERGEITDEEAQRNENLSGQEQIRNTASQDPSAQSSGRALNGRTTSSRRPQMQIREAGRV